MSDFEQALADLRLQVEDSNQRRRRDVIFMSILIAVVAFTLATLLGMGLLLRSWRHQSTVDNRRQQAGQQSGQQILADVYRSVNDTNAGVHQLLRTPTPPAIVPPQIGTTTTTTTTRPSRSATTPTTARPGTTATTGAPNPPGSTTTTTAPPQPQPTTTTTPRCVPVDGVTCLPTGGTP